MNHSYTPLRGELVWHLLYLHSICQNKKMFDQAIPFLGMCCTNMVMHAMMRVQLFDAVLSVVLAKGQKSSKYLPMCAQSQSPTPWDPMDPPGSFVHGIIQPRTLERLPFPTPGSSYPGIEPMSPCVYCTAGGFFTTQHLGSPSDSRGLANKLWSVYTMQWIVSHLEKHKAAMCHDGTISNIG